MEIGSMRPGLKFFSYQCVLHYFLYPNKVVKSFNFLKNLIFKIKSRAQSAIYPF